MDNKIIKVKVHYPECKPYKHPNGDWIDLRSAEDVEIYPPRTNIHNNEIEYQTGMIPLGISIKVPEGYETHILPRSSTFKNFKIMMTNSMGIVDNSYSSDNDIVRFPYIAFGRATIKKGDRIAQMKIIPTQDCIVPVTIEEVETLGDKERGGFGSTGIK